MRIVTGVICLGQALLPDGSLTTSCINRVCATSQLITQLLASFGNNTTTTTTANTNTSSLLLSSPPPLTAATTTALIFSGGDVKRVGKTEAQAMMDYYNNTQHHDNLPAAAHHPLPSSSSSSSSCLDILLEEQSKNTIENFLFCQSILDGLPPLEEVYIVTNDFHLPRSMLLSRAILRHQEGHPHRHIQGIAAPSSPLSSLCELLDREYQAICNINDSLSKYGLGPLPQEWIEKAQEEIRVLNCSSRSTANNTINTNLIELRKSFGEEGEKSS